MAAIRALEARSREFMREKAEKKRLEDEINRLQESVLHGGLPGDGKRGGGGGPGTPGGEGAGAVVDTPAFRNALQEHQERMRAQYEGRLAELERERESVEEEKAQVDRYKQLLLKQRDIMILLTQRLNERDEQIVALQDELDAYDAHQTALEEALDEKTAALFHLQRVTLEQQSSSPVKNPAVLEALGDWATGSGGGGGGSSASGGAGGAAMRARLDEAAADSGSLLFRPAGSEAAAAPASLSARDKVAELEGLLESTRADRDRVSRELDDTRAEKVSMEYLLREKLEKLVQTELEARLAAYRKAGGGDATAAGRVGGGSPDRRLQADLAARTEELASVRAENARADGEVRTLRTKLQQLSEQQLQQQQLVGSAAETDSLRERLAVHEKERRAIHTIMESKIKALVDAIALQAAAIAPPQAAPGAAAAQPANGRLMREVTALQRLVGAAIAALKNSENAASAPPVLVARPTPLQSNSNR